MENKISKTKYDELVQAQKILCGYCESNQCESCTVTRLMDTAYVEAGIDNTEDETPVSTAKWILDKDPASPNYKKHYCSQCGEYTTETGKPDNVVGNCPNCGSQMIWLEITNANWICI